MKFQVVVQFPAADIESFDALVEIEDELAEALESEHIVDGHDFGSGEANIFIHTNDPSEVVKTVRKCFGGERMAKAKVAFRSFDSEDYSWLHPANEESKFHVL